VIEAEGEHALKMQDIAEAVNVTKPTIYYYFGDRDGLITAALAEMYWRVLAVGSEYLVANVPKAQTPQEFEDVFRQALLMLTTPEAAQRRAMRIRVLGAAVDRPTLQTALVAMHRRNAANLMAFIKLGRAKGFVHLPFDDEVVSIFTISALTGRYYVEIDGSIDATEWDRVMFEVARHLLFDRMERPSATNA